MLGTLETTFQTAISREESDWDTKSGSQIEDFCENLILSTFLSKSLPPGVQEKKGKGLGAILPPPHVLKGPKIVWFYRVNVIAPVMKAL